MYQKTLNFLFSQLPMYQRVGNSAFKKDLTNITKICSFLGNPQNNFVSVHLAGTNGKGTVSHMLAAILQASGLKVGLYTSPHYKDFRERVKINGELIPEEEVIGFVQKIRSDLDSIQPSFFEFAVGLAFNYFSKQKVDIAIIETGLGGRLDSTNIIRPILSIITNISFDHEAFLGDTLAEIAGEKAGIIKDNVPVIIGESQPEVEAVFKQKSEATNSNIYFADSDFEAIPLDWNLNHSGFEIRYRERVKFPNLIVEAHGPFQSKNIQTALKAIELLQGHFSIHTSHIKNGFARLKSLTNYMGRWQILGEKPWVITDSAHNVAGLKLVLEAIQYLSFQKLHIVLGVVKDKNWQKIIDLFPNEAQFYFSKANIPRGLETIHLANYASSIGLNHEVFNSIKEASECARQRAKPDDLIFIGGSTFVTAEII